MTKTDFVAIQTAINDARMALWNRLDESDKHTSEVNRAFNSMARDIATTLAKQNPKFKRAEFLRGCSVV